MKTFEEIDVTKEMIVEDFCTLFKSLPLNEEEKADIKDNYFVIYKAFLSAEVIPETAWVATRNIFAVKNKQLVERIKQNG